MIIYTIKIAGCAIQITNVYDKCKTFCSEFITDDQPIISISTSQNDIEQERASYEKTNGKCEDDGTIEVYVVFKKVSAALIDNGAFLMHGAAIAVDGNGYIFTGHSGVGKSTHIKKWLLKATNSIEINGDKPYIITGDDVPIVCGSPWAGKERFYTNTAFPLKAVILLSRSANNTMEKVSLVDIFPELCQQIIRTDDRTKTKKVLQMLASIGSKVSFYRFYINNYKEDCFDIAYKTLIGDKE